jgi:tryptophan synthase alpha chain
MRLERPALAIYLVACDEAPAQAAAAVAGGATVIELGIPYSDPLADGTTIQRHAQRALDSGMTTARALEILAEIDAAVDVPLVPMTYGAIVEAYGTEAFCRDARAAGAEALIVVDVPHEESEDLRAACEENGIDLAHLVAPTSSAHRNAEIAAASRGFVYLVASMGTTGAREALDDRVAGMIAQTRESAGGTPLLVGFGISRREQVATVLAAGADGVAVGSAALDALDRGGPDALRELAADLAAGLRDAT